MEGTPDVSRELDKFKDLRQVVDMDADNRHEQGLQTLILLLQRSEIVVEFSFCCDFRDTVHQARRDGSQTDGKAFQRKLHHFIIDFQTS